MPHSSEIAALKKRIHALEQENARLKQPLSRSRKGHSVSVPEDLKPLFEAAEQTVGAYFKDLEMDPTLAKIEIHGQRYLLVRASALSTDFLATIQKLYSDRGLPEAMAIGKNLLFDLAHVIGMNDAKNFHQRMHLKDPIAKLSAGPVHFAYTGWAFVDILPESHPTPDQDFLLVYRHPYSFEADSWKRSGKHTASPVCIMNSGYSSGWCEESFGIELTAVEVSCTARGDAHCTFIMSPPERIQEHLEHFNREKGKTSVKELQYTIPTFFERKRVEEELQRSKQLAEDAAKAKSDFVANMSHELRTPLNAILGFSELMQQTPLLEEQKGYMEAINSSGSSLLGIINDILDLSKMDAGKLTPIREQFSIPHLLYNLQQMFLSQAKAKNLELLFASGEELREPVIGDPKRLQQILVNLVGNALKFTEKGTITISTAVRSHDKTSVLVQFTVQDTGIGIPEAKLNSIFERFNQGNNGIDRAFGGTGLGLSIAKQLVTLLGGTLSVESREATGSTFYFSLPFPLSTAQNPTEAAPHQVILPGTSHHLLLVEDSKINQKLATLILERHHFKITVANNGQEALDILKQQQFDLILMDIQMPVLDGCAATRIIRNDLHITIPIIALTAYALDQERTRCIKEGMNDYLAKPYKEQVLLEKIALWLSAPTPISAPSGPPLVDLTFLRAQSGNNTGFITEMMRLFIEENPKGIAELEAALAQHNLPAVRKVAHTMKSSVVFFGLDKHIGAALKQLENVQPEDQLSHLLPGIKATCIQAVSELNKLLSRPDNPTL